MIPPAAQPDIVRANQKDQSYKSQVFELCQDALRRTAGPRRAILWSRETELVSGLLYSTITTGCGQQTLGEEYCDILQIAGPAGTAPGIGRRAALVLLEEIGGYLVEHLQTYDSATASETDQVQRPVDKAATCLLACMPWALRMHLAMFYLSGVYYEWPKRLTGVKFLFYGKAFEHRPSYRILGMLMFIQLTISAGFWAGSKASGSRLAGKSSSGYTQQDSAAQPRIAKVLEEAGAVQAQASAHRCPLCLSQRDKPTSTPCGHVFCWACISAWCNHKPECPLCRAPFTGSELVRVHHADF